MKLTSDEFHHFHDRWDCIDDKSALVLVVLILVWWCQAQEILLVPRINKILLWDISAWLTHWARVTHVVGISKLGHFWFREWLVAWSAPSHFLIQCWNIINWTLGNFNEIVIENYLFSFKKMHLKLSGNCGPFCLSLNVLRGDQHDWD